MSKLEIKQSNINFGDINSFYILKNMLSFLNEKQKLNMIIYNKELQNKLSITFDYIKEISGRYIEGEKNGKGREYILNTDILLFEGEYLNGKRNGKGKLYYENGELKFEGEFLNGKKKGKGKEYYNDGKLEFEGEYLNEERNGKGKEYKSYNGKLKFEGEYLNGKRNGKGKEYDFSSLPHTVIYLDGNVLIGEKFNIRRRIFKWIKRGKRKRI